MMNISNDIFAILTNHFDTRGWPEHVNLNKLDERLSVEKSGDGETYVASIERHRGVLGATYSKGVGMFAFQTYFMQYEVNMATKEVKELPIRYLPVEPHDIDVDALVQEAIGWERLHLQISSLDNGKFLIQESVLNDEAVVDSLDGAIDFARTLSDGFEDYFDMQLDMELSEGYSPEQIRGIRAEYARLLDDALAEKASEAWRRDVDEA
jgi:hypothetical protein